MVETLKKIFVDGSHIAAVRVLFTIMVIFICLVMASWLIGYWANGLWGYRFDLASCWQGLGTAATGLMTVAGLAGFNSVKHYVDSKYNSNAGEMPQSGRR